MRRRLPHALAQFLQALGARGAFRFLLRNKRRFFLDLRLLLRDFFVHILSGLVGLLDFPLNAGDVLPIM